MNMYAKCKAKMISIFIMENKGFAGCKMQRKGSTSSSDKSVEDDIVLAVVAGSVTLATAIGS